MGSMLAMIPATTSGLSRNFNIPAPSVSDHERKYLCSWMRRRRASRSQALALVRAHSSRSSPRLAVREWSKSRVSACGSVLAASAITATCWAESSPRRAASSVAGRSWSRRAACSVSRACPMDVPEVRASRWAADRSPSRFQMSVSATRAAASASTVAAMFLIAAASSLTRTASVAEMRAGSNRVAYSLIALRSPDNFILGS